MNTQAERINVTRSSMPDFEEYCAEIRKLWDSHWLTNNGCEHRELQRLLEQRLGIEHVTLFVNGHLALENAIAAFDLPRGAEVITTPFTFASTTNAIARNGLTPVFCDVSPVDFTMDVTKVETLITDKTAAIVPVHVHGSICDVEGLARIAQEHGLKLIYDAAHAFGAKYKGVSTACFGDASMFSFHATKVFNTIEGGAICCRDAALAQKLEKLKNFGLAGTEGIYIGGNAKMNEFQAAMGICNLRDLDACIERRGAVAARYRELLGGVPGIYIPPIQKDVTPNYAYFPVLFDGYRYTRDEVFDRLAAQNIVTRKYFYPLTNGFECYRSYPTAGVEKTPVAQFVTECILTLPIYADLSLEDVDRICDIVLN